MNISLDSALGRQRRLNQVGETITSIAAPAAAYSLRSLTGGDPEVVNVRRSSDNNETKFTVSQINSGALASHIGSGNDGFVQTWYDQSGNGNHATQTDTGKQPKIVSSGSLLTQGGKACINFDGTNDFFERATYTQGTLSQPNTFFAVAKLDAFTNTNRKIYDSHDASARNVLFVATTGNGQFAHFAGTTRTTGEDGDANQHLFTSLTNGAASRLRIDSTQKSTDDVGSQSMTGLVIGSKMLRDADFWDGDMQEIIVYNSNQTSNFTAIEGNINSYYSIF